MKKNDVSVLLVEDNEGDAELFREAVQEHSHIHVRVAEDGSRALDILKGLDGDAEGSRPHMIILDLNLPELPGDEFLGVIKNDARWRSIPVVIFTSSESEKDIEKAYSLYANAYVVKPTRFDEYKDTINQIMTFWCGTAQLHRSDNS